MLQLLNDLGAPAGHWGRLMLFQSALLVALLLAVDFLLGRRLRSAMRYALWLLVLVKLLLPPSLLLPTGAGFWLGRWWAEPVRTAPATTTPTPRLTVTTAEASPVPDPEWIALPPPIAQAPATLTRDACLLLAWISGALLLAAGFGIRNRPVRRLARRAADAPEDLQAQVREAANALRLRRIPKLRLSAANHSPAVCGFLRPVILLPAELAGRLTPDALRLVLLHELAHLKRGDLWVTWWQALVQIVWWWNPAVWIANARIRMLREAAVDDVVMLSTPDDRSAYPSALLAVARHCASGPQLALSFLGIFESRGSLRSRLTRLLQGPLPGRPNLGVTGWMLCLAAGFLLLPMAFERRVEAAAAEPLRDPTAAVGVPASDSSQPGADITQRTAAITNPGPAFPVPSFPYTNLVRLERSPFIQVFLPKTAEGFVLDDKTLTEEELTRELSSRRQSDKNLEVLFFPEEGVPALGLFPATEAARAAGFTHVKVSTPTPPKGAWKLGEVFLLTKVDLIQPLFTRTYRVNPRTFLSALRSVTGDPPVPPGDGTNGLPQVQLQIREFFRACGVDFPTPPSEVRKAIFFSDRTGILFVRATEADLEVIEKAIQALNVAPPQVEIQAMFVILDAERMNSLGLDFLLKDRPDLPRLGTNAASGILTEPQFRSVLNTLESRPGVQFLSAPKVITLSGRQAMFSATDPTSVSDASGRAHEIPFGLVVDAIPYVMADDLTIQLTVIAGLSELVVANPAAPLPLRIRSSEIISSAALWDSQTLVIAGDLVEGDAAIRDDPGAAPGGRPFPHWEAGPDVQRTGQRLLVFVTPVIIDPSGRRVNNPGP